MSGRRIAAWTLRGMGILVLIIVAAGGGLVLWLRTSLPPTSGRLVLPGLSDAAQVTRGGDGVPRIAAGNARDAAFALGFVHAEDRMFQMDLMRRYGEGRISEIAGKRTLGIDRFMRTLGLAHAAERQLGNLSEPVRQFLDAYAAGVNAYIAHHSGAKQPYYDFVPGPEPWRPLDTLVIGKIFALYLSQNFRREIEHARIARSVTPQQLEELFPPRDVSGFTTLAALAPVLPKLPLDALAASMPSAIGQPDASNDWVVDGAHSVTGKPILENDPHLTYTAPSIWYLAQLKFGDFALTGGTIPGTPFLVVGHNGHVGWGFTETGSDVEDLFIEKVDTQHPQNYLAPQGSRPFTTRREVIHVRGGADVVMAVRATRHGPVISDALAGAKDVTPPGGYVLALEATFLEDGDRTPDALWGMATAHDWGEFERALRDFGAPQMNIVYADTGGTIAFAAPARVPIRKSGNGWLPAPGWTGEFDWTGYIPFAALPRAVNPHDGRFVTANNKIVPDDYPYFLGRDWALPDRAERITSLLGKEPRQSLESTAAIAADTLSGPAARLLPLMLRMAPADDRSKAALAVLRGWDARMERDSAAPLIFVAWLRELNRALFAAKLGDEFQAYWSLHPVVIEHVLEGGTSWCGGPAQPAPRQCATMLSQSLAHALGRLAGDYGGDMRRWRWGEPHQATFRNPVLAQVPVFGGWLTPQIPADGGKYTVNAGDMDIGSGEHPYRDTLGPGFRMILDFSDLAASRFMMSPGVSANPLSAHYGDLLRRWRDLDWLVVGREQGGDTLTLAPPGHAPS